MQGVSGTADAQAAGEYRAESALLRDLWKKCAVIACCSVSPIKLWAPEGNNHMLGSWESITAFLKLSTVADIY